jgi:hypothetical protein
MLSLAAGVTYVYEPFSVGNSKGISNPHWYPYITDENEGKYRAEMERVVQLRPPLKAVFENVQGLRDAWGRIQQWAKFIRGRYAGHRPLLKDPVALCSAEWIAETFGAQVVVMIRHPLAFAGSCKKLNWQFPFGDFLEQPRLLKVHLHSFENEIRAFAEQDRDVVDQAILLWNMLYTVVRKYRDKHDDWAFVRHEDLARAPVEGFRDLYKHFDLPFTDAVQQSIRAHSRSSNPTDPSNAINTQRDSRSTLYTWQDRLSAEEADRVRTETRGVAEHFYDDAVFEESASAA